MGKPVGMCEVKAAAESRKHHMIGVCMKGGGAGVVGVRCMKGGGAGVVGARCMNDGGAGVVGVLTTEYFNRSRSRRDSATIRSP